MKENIVLSKTENKLNRNHLCYLLYKFFYSKALSLNKINKINIIDA